MTGRADSVKVEFIGAIREIAGTGGVALPLPGPITVAAIAAELVAMYGAAFEREMFARAYPDGPAFYQILVNGRNIHSLEGMDTRVNPGDSVLISPPLCGG